MNRTFFHWSSSRSASSARRSISDECLAVSGNSSSSSSRRASRDRPLTRLAQHAVHDEVRVTANRRGEVRVVLNGQPEVPEAHRVVPRLLHRPQHQRGDRALLRCPAHTIDQLLKMFRRQGTPARGKAVAERGDEGFELLDLLGIGRLVHTMQRRDGLPFEMGRHRLVGEQHELFDDAVRDVALARHNRFNLADLRQDDFGLR